MDARYSSTYLLKREAVIKLQAPNTKSAYARSSLQKNGGQAAGKSSLWDDPSHKQIQITKIQMF